MFETYYMVWRKVLIIDIIVSGFPLQETESNLLFGNDLAMFHSLICWASTGHNNVMLMLALSLIQNLHYFKFIFSLLKKKKLNPQMIGTLYVYLLENKCLSK